MIDDDTLQEMLRYGARMDVLRERFNAAEEQLLHRLGVSYRSGQISMDAVLDVYDRIRPWSAQGFTKRWREAIGPEFTRADNQRRHLRHNAWRYERNMPEGWEGTVEPPAGEDVNGHISWPVPPPRQPVVYVLYGNGLEPLYAGSTQMFRDRLKWHLSDGKPVTYWRAVPADDRDDAYRREDAMLRAAKPSMNRKARR